MFIGVTNQSSEITNQDAYSMTLAVARQVRYHAAPAWGILPPSVTYLSSAAQAPHGSAVISIFDDADQAGDLGWHTEGPDGTVYGRVFARPVLQNGGGVLSKKLSVASVLSHEVLETMGDAACNRWADVDGIRAYAQELGDPVESDSYPITINATGGASVTATVSNFVLPEWFDPQAPAGSQYDHMGLLSKPFEVRPDGYVIVLAEGRVTTHFGEQYPVWRKAMKEAETSRTARRIARHAVS